MPYIESENTGYLKLNEYLSHCKEKKKNIKIMIGVNRFIKLVRKKCITKSKTIVLVKL